MGLAAVIGVVHHQIYVAQLCLGQKENRDTKWKTPGSFVNISRVWLLAVGLKHPRQQGGEGESEGAATGLRGRPTHYKRLLVFSSDSERSRSAQF